MKPPLVYDNFTFSPRKLEYSCFTNMFNLMDKHISSNFPRKEYFPLKCIPEKYEDVLFPLVSINPKFILGGSLVLHMLGILKIDFDDRFPDLDLVIESPLNEMDFMIIKDFFNLKYLNKSRYWYGNEDNSNLQPWKNKIIQFGKLEKNSSGDNNILSLKIDIFNGDSVIKKDIFYVDYKGIRLKMVHPSTIISHKLKYALDDRINHNSRKKHLNDLECIDWQLYEKIICNIEYLDNEWVYSENPRYEELPF